MRRTTLAAALVAFAALPLAAQKKLAAAPKQAAKPTAIKVPAAAVGTWDGKAMMGPKDSVVSTFTLTLNANGSGTEIMPNRDPIATKVLAAGGDSIVTETARFKSVLRPNVTVVTRATFHLKGNMMSGHAHATYSDGTSRELKTAAIKKK